MATRARLLLPLCAVSFTCPADSLPIKVYPAPRVRDLSREQADPILIDGELREEAWTNAPAAAGFVELKSPAPVPVQTEFKVVFNDTHLYIALICHEPLVAKLRPDSCPHDSTDVFKTEAVELFIDPEHDHGHYYQIALNAAGSTYDSEGTVPIWDSGVRVSTAIGDRCWTA